VLYRSPPLMLGAAGSAARLLPERAAFSLHAHVILALRTRALRRMAERIVDAPVTFFRSAEYRDEIPDFGWKAFCPGLKIIDIGGDHVTIIMPPILEILRDRVVEELNKSLSSASGNPA
jgi:thioesterase domain-containing protein